jgi:prepilin-type N-terminal cleavage/methylation domain-containing protein
MDGSFRHLACRRRSGLTLPELLVAIVLFGTLGALLLPRLGSGPAHPPISSPAPGSEPEQTQRGFIGAQLDRSPTSDGYVRVRGLVGGGPAHLAGLQPFDAILRVDGASTRRRGVDAVVHMITRGRPGTPVRLTIRRSRPAATRDLRIIRKSFTSVYLPGIVDY